MTIWQKQTDVDDEILKFTVGNDYLLDQKLLKYDCIASIAHAKMLNKMGYLNKDELDEILIKLNQIIENGLDIKITEEDCHFAIEKSLGDIGKKIHFGRSRNDQVLVALRLFEVDELKNINKLIENLLKINIKKVDIPGFTHMQFAMPTDTKTWFSSYKESMKENLKMINFLIQFINKSPLGSAAGYGLPINIDKKFTADELGMEVIENPIYAQYTRAKYDFQIMNLSTTIAYDLNKISSDLIQFNLLGYVKLPLKYCTGSSIMPQKHNPDVLELIRAKYHIITGNETKYKSLVSNLMMGYNRDIQLSKELIINSIEILKECLVMTNNMMPYVEFQEIELPKELFATSKAYEYVKKGMTFRDAYKMVGEEYEK